MSTEWWYCMVPRSASEVEIFIQYVSPVLVPGTVRLRDWRERETLAGLQNGMLALSCAEPKSHCICHM